MYVFKKGQPVQWILPAGRNQQIDLGWVAEDRECEIDGHVAVFWLLENKVMLSWVRYLKRVSE